MQTVCRQFTLALLSALLATCAFAASPPACKGLLDHNFPALLTGNPQSLCDYAGKVVLVVNTASQCGYTPQYEGLEALYKRYQKRGLVVVGFPSAGVHANALHPGGIMTELSRHLQQEDFQFLA